MEIDALDAIDFLLEFNLVRVGTYAKRTTE